MEDGKKAAFGRNEKTKQIVFCAVFTALTAVCSQIAIPIHPVPVNLATMAVFLAGAVLGARLGAMSQLVYVLLGAVGLPVFSSFSGGLGTLVGPTGGYLFGYIAAAWAVGFLTERFGAARTRLVPAMIAGLAVCYALGSAWFMLYTHTSLWETILLCVVPFLPGDAAKIAVATVIAPTLRAVSPWGRSAAL